MKILTIIAALALAVACEERLAEPHDEPARAAVADAAAEQVSPALPMTCGPTAAAGLPQVQLCVDDETGCHYFAGPGYGFVPRIGVDGQHFGCHDLVPELVTQGDADRETIVYLEPTNDPR